jgi:hypothetical protein
MLEILKIIAYMVKVYFFGRVEQNIKEIGKKERGLEMELCITKMERFIMDSFKMGNNMVEELKHGLFNQIMEI